MSFYVRLMSVFIGTSSGVAFDLGDRMATMLFAPIAVKTFLNEGSRKRKKQFPTLEEYWGASEQ